MLGLKLPTDPRWVNIAEMNIDEIQARRCAPMAEQTRLDVLLGQRLLQQRIVEQIDLPDRQVVRGPPVGVDLPQLVRAKWTGREGVGRRERGASAGGVQASIQASCERLIHVGVPGCGDLPDMMRSA